MYDKLVKQLRAEECLPYTSIKTMRDAADAIEELSQLVTFYESATDGYWNDLQRAKGYTDK